MANILEKTNGQVTARGGLSLNDIVYIIRNVSGLTGEDAITTLNNLKLLFTIEPYAALIFGATVTWDALTGLNKTLEATGDFTLAITNHENGMSGDLSLTVTNPTTITLPAGSNVSGSFTAIESGDYLVKWDYDGTQFYFSIESGASSTTPAGATGDIQLNDGVGGLGVASTSGDGRYASGVFRFDSIKSQFKTLTPAASINQDARQGVNSSVSYGSNFNVSLTNIESGMAGIILLDALDYIDFTLQEGDAVWEKEPASPLAIGSHSVHWFTDGVDVYASIKNYAYRAKVSLYSNHGAITIDVYLNDNFVEAITSGTDVTTTKIYNIKNGDLLSIRLVEGGGIYYSYFYPYVNGEAKPSDQLDYTSYGNNVDILCNYIPPL